MDVVKNIDRSRSRGLLSLAMESSIGRFDSYSSPLGEYPFCYSFFAFSVVGGKDKGQASNDNKGRALENAGNNEGKRGPSNDDYGRTEELMTG